MIYHTVAVPTQLKSVALSTLFPSLPNKRRSSDISQTVTLPTFVNYHNFEEMWSDVLNVALPTCVNCRNSDEMWSEVLNITLPTFVNCRNSNEMWSNVFILSLFRRFLGCHNSDAYKASVYRWRVQFKKKK